MAIPPTLKKCGYPRNNFMKMTKKHRFHKNKAKIDTEIKAEDILGKLKILWRQKELKIQEKKEYLDKYRKSLGEEQEIQRQINEILKQNAENLR